MEAAIRKHDCATASISYRDILDDVEDQVRIDDATPRKLMDNLRGFGAQCDKLLDLEWGFC